LLGSRSGFGTHDGGVPVDAEAFFARIRARRGATTELEVPPPPPARDPVTLERFERALIEIGGSVVRTARAELPDAIARIARSHQLERFVAWRTPLLVELGLAAELGRRGLRELGYPADPSRARAVLHEAEIGIVEADFAVAETGTIGLMAGPNRGRLVTALPSCTIALLDLGGLEDPKLLLGRLEDVPGFLKGRGEVPSALTMISGPSRTADIAGRIVVGMHGARQLYVLALTP
jgi:L-lactate dehydrogenase complex protein LldG